MSPSSTVLLQEALRLHRQGALSEAVRIYMQVLQAEPGNADAHYYVAFVAYQQGRFGEAADGAAEALKLAPREARAHRLHSQALRRLGRPAEALTSIEQAIACAPEIAAAHGARADLLVEMGRVTEAIASYDRAVALEPASIDDWCNRGAALDELRRYEDAIACYDRVIALNPAHVEGHYNRANALARLDLHQDALAAYDQALALRPQFVEALNNRGLLLKTMRREAAALASYDQALALRPGFVQALINRGVVLKALRRDGEARASYEQALAVQPDNIDALTNLALLHLAREERRDALRLLMRALTVRPTPGAKLAFADCVKIMPPDQIEVGVENVIAQALSEGWVRPYELGAVAAALIKQDPAVKSFTDHDANAKNPDVSGTAQIGATALTRLAENNLLKAFLVSTPVCDIELETRLTALRRSLLDTTATAAANAIAVADNILAFHCALARQCFINDYVFSVGELELRQIDWLRSQVDRTSDATKIPWLWIVALSAYLPLRNLSAAPMLLAGAWPEPVQNLLKQQIEEPEGELKIRDEIPALTPIPDGVSQLVRHQYEEMPYPRWIGSALIAKAVGIDQFVRDSFPLAPFRDLAKAGPVEILIAGCGTGRQTVELAQQIANCNVLAIDLSRASLAYAKRKAAELGLHHIAFAQADILHLPSLGRSFDVIDSSGVLHHLAEPMTGWRHLVSILRPGGVMRIGLYSAMARQEINAARHLAVTRGYQPTAHDIRRLRQELIANNDGVTQALLQCGDFFSTSECRDLLFHVQEHQMTLPAIKTFLLENNLAFLGFEIEPPVREQYLRRFPADPAGIDLDNWHRFEQDNAAVFRGMYQFWVQKPQA
jgi:tetratricopeptide (TPR) repeat protein/SAM-dependent methyltransferase